jgi:hypothetical protein
MVEGRQNILGITPEAVIESWLELLSTLQSGERGFADLS